MDDIRFPAVAVSPGESFYVTSSIPAQASVKALRSCHFERLYLFDSSGHRWRVKSIHASPSRLDRLLNRVVPVALSFDDAGPARAADVAEELCTILDRDPDDIYNQWISHDELKQRFRSCSSVVGLIELARTLGELA